MNKIDKLVHLFTDFFTKEGPSYGYDQTEIKELLSEIDFNNLNQLTKRVHETGRIYDADLEDIKQGQERIWDMADTIITKLTKLK